MTDKFISIEGIAKRYPGAGGGTIAVFENLWLVDGARRVRLRDRAFRLRQDHRARTSSPASTRRARAP